LHSWSAREQHAAKVTDACRLIEASEDAPSLEELATHAGVSPYHFLRLFKAITGLTPRQYAAAHRANRMRKTLDRSRTVTDAIYDAGYGSNDRFYERSDEILGMAPSKYRAGGAHTDIRFAVGECSLGSILVAQSERGVCAILLGDDPETLAHELQDRFPRGIWSAGRPAAFEHVVSTVVGFVEAPALGLNLPLDVQGTAFQQRVWQALQSIPAGSTATYTDIAHRIGSPTSVRRSLRPAAPMPWQWRFLVIVSCERTAPCRDTAGGSNASACCSNERHRDERRRQKTLTPCIAIWYGRTTQ
jgi:AraC family transcriptional regulator of adaptative response/methylated-DNA-[protein]-cysteine methyltransferase